MNYQRIEQAPQTKPSLVIVIDTESEFDWHRGTQADQGEVTAVTDLPILVDQLGEMGAPVCLVLDHPMASTHASAKVVARLAEQGAELGVHLQPWTTPPPGEPLLPKYSFCSNLSSEAFLAKASLLHREVQQISKTAVRVFKAGRYGMGWQHFPTIESLGMDIDLSLAPCYDMSAEEGPNWSGLSSFPAWVGQPGSVLELPTTAALLGPLRHWLSRGGASNRAVHLYKRLHLARAHRLSPEANPLSTLLEITDVLHRGGLRVFTLSLHSPSLKPGCTPYTRTIEERDAFVRCVLDYVREFRSRWGGQVMLPSALRTQFESALQGGAR